jgi:hypothetical protein
MVAISLQITPDNPASQNKNKRGHLNRIIPDYLVGRIGGEISIMFPEAPAMNCDCGEMWFLFFVNVLPVSCMQNHDRILFPIQRIDNPPVSKSITV